MKASERKFLRLVREAATLPMRLRLGLIEELKVLAAFENEQGLRFGPESLSEYKRAKKSRAQQEPLVRWLASFGPTDVFFDIGANIGGLSLMAARLHEGRVPVVAFEPASDSFAALVRNIHANHCANVITPLHVTLLDETGVRPFYRSRLGAGSALHAVGEALDYATSHLRRLRWNTCSRSGSTTSCAPASCRSRRGSSSTSTASRTRSSPAPSRCCRAHRATSIASSGAGDGYDANRVRSALEIYRRALRELRGVAIEAGDRIERTEAALAEAREFARLRRRRATKAAARRK